MKFQVTSQNLGLFIKCVEDRNFTSLLFGLLSLEIDIIVLSRNDSVVIKASILNRICCVFS